MPHKLFPFVLGLLFVVCPASAQEPLGYAGAAKLLTSKAVQEELRLSGEQLQKAGQVLRDVGGKYKDSFADLKKLPMGERLTKYNQLIDEMNTETFKGLKDILDAKQMERLRQLDRREQGPRIFRDPDILKELKLTDEQRAKLTKISLDGFKEIGEIVKANADKREEAAKKVAAVQRKTLDEIIGLFTDDQKKVWQKLIGEPPTGEEKRPEPRKEGNTSKPDSSSAATTVRRIDEMLRDAWKLHGITPAPPVDDERFLRRIHVDLTGTLPAPEKIIRFLEDRDANKRGKAIDELLASEAYATHSANYWYAILMGRTTREAFIDRGAFRDWLHQSFKDNMPWDEFVRRLVSAEGYNSGRPRGKNAPVDPEDLKERLNPATNWYLRYFKALPELSAATSKTFLGVQIQCAQCHDHKDEKWTKQDYRQFTAFYAKSWPVYMDAGKTASFVGIFRMDLKDRPAGPPVTGKAEVIYGSYKDYLDVAPKFLQGKEVAALGANRRKELADWMTAADNPWFAKAIVNRTWARLLGRGFVEPIDDFRTSNPALLPDTLQALADDFVAHQYDVRHLLRAICQTEAYQRACAPTHKPSGEFLLWSRYPVKPLEIEVMLEAVLGATGSGPYLDKISKGKLSLVRDSIASQFVMQMGTDDMAEVTDFDETVPKALMFLNGSLLNGATRKTPGLALHQVLESTTDDRQRIEQLYLRTLSRRPTATETDSWLKYLKEPQPVVHTPGPATNPITGPDAQKVSPAIANAPRDADFNELVKHARTGADFAALAQRMRNNADAGLYAKAIEAWSAETPLQFLASQPGGNTAQEQAYENLFWALVNSSEFLSNH